MCVAESRDLALRAETKTQHTIKPKTTGPKGTSERAWREEDARRARKRERKGEKERERERARKKKTATNRCRRACESVAFGDGQHHRRAKS